MAQVVGEQDLGLVFEEEGTEGFGVGRVTAQGAELAVCDTCECGYFEGRGGWHVGGGAVVCRCVRCVRCVIGGNGAVCRCVRCVMGGVGGVRSVGGVRCVGQLRGMGGVGGVGGKRYMGCGDCARGIMQG